MLNTTVSIHGVCLIDTEEACDDILTISRALFNTKCGLMHPFYFFVGHSSRGLKEKKGNLILVLKVCRMMTSLSV